MQKITVFTTLLLVAFATSFSVHAKKDDFVIIAHRGGQADWLENTIYAFTQAKIAGVDMIELDLQVTSDGYPVVYHKRDLSELTTGSGAVSSRRLSDIQKMSFKDKVLSGAPKNTRIPILNEVLKEFPAMNFIIDLKSKDSDKLIGALVKHVPEMEWPRLIFYSTETSHLETLIRAKPQALFFESRDKTRMRVVQRKLYDQCGVQNETASWIGFEMDREMVVTEKFAIGEGQTKIKMPVWDKETIACTKKMAPNAKIIVFGVDTMEQLELVKKLKVDGVMTNAPLVLKGFKGVQ